MIASRCSKVMAEHRIGDRRVLRLIAKWLKAGVMEEGALTESTEGTPRARSSPRSWRTSTCITSTTSGRTGGALHPDKTRLIEFGRHAAQRRSARGLGKPETFDFLGFTHICGKAKEGGWFTLVRHTIAKRMRAKLVEIKEALNRMRHVPVPEQGRWLGQVVRGYLAYHAVPTNSRKITSFQYHVAWHWRRALARRSQKGRVTWAQARGDRRGDCHPLRRRHHRRLPAGGRCQAVSPRSAGAAGEVRPGADGADRRALAATRQDQPSWPQYRFLVKHPRWEPSALAAPARICPGGAG